MKISRKYRKRLIALFVITATIMFLFITLNRLFRHALDKFQVSYDAVSFGFPASLEIDGLRVSPSDSVELNIDLLEISWSWGSLIRQEPAFRNVLIDQGNLRIIRDGESSFGGSSLPVLSLENIRLEDFTIHYRSGSDQATLNIAACTLTSAMIRDTLHVDSLMLYHSNLAYEFKKLPDTAADQQAVTTSQRDAAAAWKKIPGFRLNFLDLDNVGIRVSDGKDPLKIDSLNFRFKGWKSWERADVKIEELGFVYQDTLDVKLVLENGKVNNDFQTVLDDLTLSLPGVSLNLEEASVKMDSLPEAELFIADSYLSLGSIRSIYPAIDSILNPELEDGSRIRIYGNLLLEGKTLNLSSLSIRVLDSTLLVLNGSVCWEDHPELKIKLSPFESNRNDLTRLLHPADYHRYYNWPEDVRGSVSATGTPDRLGISGTLDTRQGMLQVESVVENEDSGSSMFSLDIRSDLVRVDQLIPLLPVEIPYVKLSFFLQQKSDMPDLENTMLIRLTGQDLGIMDMEIEEIGFTYHADPDLNNIQVEIIDTSLSLTASTSLQPGTPGPAQFNLDVEHFRPALVDSTWPDVDLFVSAHGEYQLDDQDIEAGLYLEEVILENERVSHSFPASHWHVTGREDRISVEASADQAAFLDLTTGSSFPDFQLPLTGWLDRWPETNLQMNLAIRDDLFRLLTGEHGTVVLEDLRVKKDTSKWMALLRVPTIHYKGIDMQQMKLDLAMENEGISGGLTVEQIANESISMDSLVINLQNDRSVYALNLEGIFPEPGMNNRLALRLEDLDEGYRITFDETTRQTIFGNQWTVKDNRGIELNEQFQLSQGDLILQAGNTSLEMKTMDEEVRMAIDSLSLDGLLGYLTGEQMAEGGLNARATYNLPGKRATLDATIGAMSELVPGPMNIAVSGTYDTTGLVAGLQLSHEHMNAEASLSRGEKGFIFDLLMERVDMELLKTLPVWPDNVAISGALSGRANGEIGDDTFIDGILVPNDIQLITPLSASAIYLDQDTLLLHDGSLILDRLSIRDSSGSSLSVDGTMQWRDTPGWDLSVKSDGFALLNNRNTSRQMQGYLPVRMDLGISGGMDQTTVSGQISTLAGTDVRYVSENSFQLVDASQVVTFIDLEREEEAEINTAADPMKIEWDVTVGLQQAQLEILLDEIKQQYLEIMAEGSLDLRPGLNQEPSVYGTIQSSSGRAYIRPPSIPELNLVIEDAALQWNGPLDDPLISFTGYEKLKAPNSGLSTQFDESTNLVNYKVMVLMDEVTLESFDIRFDLESTDSETQRFLSSLSQETRQDYALNLLVFGMIGSEKIPKGSAMARRVTSKLNELARRNFKNTGLSFSTSNYVDGSDGIMERSRTDISYALNRGFLENRLSVSVGGSVGVYMDDPTSLPPSNLIGDIEFNYRISEKPSLILKGSRKNIYEGIIDGVVTEESVGIYYQKSYPRMEDVFPRKKDQKKE